MQCVTTRNSMNFCLKKQNSTRFEIFVYYVLFSLWSHTINHFMLTFFRNNSGIGVMSMIYTVKVCLAQAKSSRVTCFHRSAGFVGEFTSKKSFPFWGFSSFRTTLNLVVLSFTVPRTTASQHQRNLWQNRRRAGRQPWPWAWNRPCLLGLQYMSWEIDLSSVLVSHQKDNLLVGRTSTIISLILI